MSRSKARRIPAYLLHKSRGLAKVRIDGKDHYLGEYGSPESYEKYDDLIGKHIEIADLDATSITISELLALYWRYAKKRYGEKGKGPNGAAVNRRPIIRMLRQRHGRQRPRDFGPLAFREMIEAMPGMGWSRTYANEQIARVKQIFKWAVSRELIDVVVCQRLLTVDGIRMGEGFRETVPVEPVADDVVVATIPYMQPHIASMVRLQRLTGCRPAEVTIMRPCDIDRTNDVWIYTPESHKTQHHGKERRIAIGPKAQAILAPYLLRSAETCCFPTRRSPRYTTDSYRRQIQRACEIRAADLNIALVSWSPNQLRHALGTQVRDVYDAEHAQASLGHSRLQTTEVYAAASTERMLKVARDIG